MRIISSFKDYYDVIQAHGADSDLVFCRETVEHKLSRSATKHNAGVQGDPRYDKLIKHFEPAFRSIYRSKFYFSGSMLNANGVYPANGKWGELFVNQGVVLFIGKPYVYFRISRAFKSVNEPKTDRRYIYDLDELNELIQEHGAPDLFSKSRISSWTRRRANSELLDICNYALKQSFADFALEHKAPIIHVADHETCYVYPRLAELEFYKAVEPWKAYQELSMFFGNIAAPDLVPVTVSNKNRIQQHGFDVKYGFRTRPKDD